MIYFESNSPIYRYLTVGLYSGSNIILIIYHNFKNKITHVGLNITLVIIQLKARHFREIKIIGDSVSIDLKLISKSDGLQKSLENLCIHGKFNELDLSFEFWEHNTSKIP